MSRALAQVKLAGYEGPVSVSTRKFEEILETLNIRFQRKFIKGNFLKDACRNIPGYVEQFRPVTDDLYEWFWAHRFRTRSGSEVVILIPWSSPEKEDDRAVAVYTVGMVENSEIMFILKLFGEECLVLAKRLTRSHRPRLT